MILQDITDKLQEIDNNVFYGMVDETMNKELWNYIVFDRTRKKIGANRTGFSDIYTIHIVRENFIPEGLEEEVIDKMLDISGMRLLGEDGTYDYVQKPNTNVVVEMFSISFVKPKKV